MDRKKVSGIMDSVAEKMLKECKKNNNNGDQILLLAKALNELDSIRARGISAY